MKKQVPVLGPAGWVDSPDKKLDVLMAHIYASDASQSYFFHRQVSSIAKVIKDNEGKLENARVELRQCLTEYFKKYFDNVEVEVYIYENNSFLKGELVLSAEVSDDGGKVIQLHEVMTNKGSLARKILDYQYEG